MSKVHMRKAWGVRMATFGKYNCREKQLSHDRNLEECNFSQDQNCRRRQFSRDPSLEEKHFQDHNVKK